MSETYVVGDLGREYLHFTPRHEPEWIVQCPASVAPEQVAAFQDRWQTARVLVLPEDWTIRLLRDPAWEPQGVLVKPSVWERYAPLFLGAAAAGAFAAPLLLVFGLLVGMLE